MAIWLFIFLVFGLLVAYLIILKRGLKVMAAKNQKLQEVNRAKTEFVFLLCTN